MRVDCDVCGEYFELEIEQYLSEAADWNLLAEIERRIKVDPAFAVRMKALANEQNWKMLMSKKEKQQHGYKPPPDCLYDISTTGGDLILSPIT